VENPHTTHLAAGGTLLGFGGGGLLALLIYQATPNANAWNAVWFLLAFSFLAALTAFGAYLFSAATYVSLLPLPRTRYERENAPDVKVESFQLLGTDPSGKVRFQIGLANDGRGDVMNAGMNVLVPDWVGKVYRSGAPGGSCLSTPEPTLVGQSGGSVYWNETGLNIYGRHSYLLSFEAEVSARARLPRPHQAAVLGFTRGHRRLDEWSRSFVSLQAALVAY
jgi:hypothetical protein